MTKILVLYYSRYGATQKLAHEIARGITSVSDCEAIIRTVPSISANTQATEAKVPEDGPLYVTKEELQNCDGIALGSPTRFGNMSSAMKYFWDGTGDLWASGALIDKPVCVFTSSASLHGGQESTLLTMMIPLLHHGCIVMGLPYSNPELSATTTGGTPYGVSHVAGGNSDNPLSDDEKKLCFAQGKRLAQKAMKLKA